MILPNEAHSYITKNLSKSYLCIISKDHIPYFCKKIEGLRAISPLFELPNIENEIDKIKNPINLFFLKGTIYNLLGEYYENTKFVHVEEENKSFLHAILDYINNHYMEDITLKDVAREMNYTYNYASMLFNKTFKMSFSEFLNKCRISYSCNLLINSNYTISEIASNCGYNSLRIFNRNFLKFKKLTPSQYKKINRFIVK